MEQILKQISQELMISESQVKKTVELIDEGNTIPFIARYRKEVTGNLDDEQLRNLNTRLTYLRNLNSRKEEILRLIEQTGNLTEEIASKINTSSMLTELEDIYRPFKPKKRTRAIIAKEQGLEPLAKVIIEQKEKNGNKEEIAAKYINEELGVTNIQEALNGAMDIIAEDISDNPDFRKMIRKLSYETGKIESKAINPDESTVYDMYYDFKEDLTKILPHRILAINRGEKEKILKIKLEVNEERIIEFLEKQIILNDSIFLDELKEAILDSYKRLIKPSIERELRSEKFEEASTGAIKVFGVNVKNLLMQAPLKDCVVMGFDPAYRTGCKIAIIDDTGKLLDYTTIYPTAPQQDIEGSEKKLLELISKYNVDIISIGNGTASRESEKFVADTIKKCKKEVYYTIVSEAGASVYSASQLATKEYPDINVSIRGAISIARRLQDPLAELVKIDPKSIGVGQYQHDVNQKELDNTLTGVVEQAVNSVGVDLNTATPSLLEYVSGINSSIASNIVKYRDENSKFKSRKELLKVAKLGKVAFEQCAGFLKVGESKNILDSTMVHPESYDVAEKLIEYIGYDIKKLDLNSISGLIVKLDSLNIPQVAQKLNVGIPTLTDIIFELKKPGRDIRETMPKPILKSDVLKLEDLEEGMILTGTIRNVIDFGAFVDIGIKGDGLVHISQLSDKFVRNPMEEVSVGDVVKVKVIKIDKEKNKVSLSMRGIE